MGFGKAPLPDDVDIFDTNKDFYNDDKIFIPMFLTQETVKNSYFIRSRSNKELFVHPKRETKKALEYEMKKGIIGAAIWTKKEAKAFIKSGTKKEQRDLELVNVQDVQQIDEIINKRPFTLHEAQVAVIDKVAKQTKVDRSEIAAFLVEMGVSLIIGERFGSVEVVMTMMQVNLESQPQFKEVVDLICKGYEAGRNSNNPNIN